MDFIAFIWMKLRKFNSRWICIQNSTIKWRRKTNISEIKAFGYKMRADANLTYNSKEWRTRFDLNTHSELNGMESAYPPHAY